MEKLIIFTFCLNLFLFVIYEKLAKLINIYDYPSKRKIHSKPTPIMGGIIIYINIICLFVYIIFIDNSLKSLLMLDNNKIILSFVLTFSLIFFLGLYDDKFETSPNLRLVLLSIFIFQFLYFNNNFLISELNFSFLDEIIFLKKAGFIFTFLCILVFIISMNMFDGTNLQSLFYYLFLIVYFLTQSVQLNLFLVFLLIPILFFGIKNYQGKAFLGDGGTYLISFIFSLIIISNHKYLSIKSDEIALILIFPIVEVVRLYFSRIFENKNPFQPDKNHFHHLIIGRFNENYSRLIIIFSFLLPFIFYKILNNSLIAIILFLISYFIMINKMKKIKLNT